MVKEGGGGFWDMVGRVVLKVGLRGRRRLEGKKIREKLKEEGKKTGRVGDEM